MRSIFNLSIPQLTQWSRRQPVDHRLQNEPVQALNRMMTGIASPRMKLVSGVVAETGISQFKLAEEAGTFPDHLICHTWDGETEGEEDVLIAKPWLLRKTPFDGQTRGQVRYVYDVDNSAQRFAYDSNDTPDSPQAERNKRNELISPQYAMGDELIAARIAKGVPVWSSDGDGEPVLIRVFLIDASGGRAWTVFYELL